MKSVISPNNINDNEAQKLAQSQGISTIITISHLPDGSTKIMGV